MQLFKYFFLIINLCLSAQASEVVERICKNKQDIPAQLEAKYFNEYFLKQQKDCPTYHKCGVFLPWQNSSSLDINKQKLTLGYISLQAYGLLKENLNYKADYDQVLRKVLPYLRDRSINEVTYSKVYQRFLTELFSQFEQQQDTTITALSGVAGKFICWDGNSSDDSCDEAFKRTMHLMSMSSLDGRKMDPMVFGQKVILSQPDVFKRILSDKIYLRTLKTFNKDMIDAIVHGENILSGDIESRLMGAVKISYPNISTNLTESIVWDILTFYGTRGNSVYLLAPYFGKHIQSAKHILSELMIFGTVITYMDVLKFKHDQSYFSYPGNPKSSCYYGVPYHFWMPATLTRKLMKEGLSKRAAHNGVYLSSVLYEGLAMTGNRFNHVAKYAKLTPAGESRRHRMRQNLTFTTLGAMYGTKMANADELDIDFVMGVLQKRGANAHEMMKDDFFRDVYVDETNIIDFLKSINFFYWKEVFNPYILVK